MICTTCKLPRHQPGDAAVRRAILASLPFRMMVAIAGLDAASPMLGEPLCWHDSDEQCAAWIRWETEDAAELAARGGP